MRKTIFAVCIAFCLLSTGCGNVTNQEAETPSAATTETATEASTETTGTSVETTTEITETSVEATTEITETSVETTTEVTETSDVTAADVTTQIASNASAEITPEPTSTNVLDSGSQSSTDQAAPTVEQAQELIRALNMVERLGGGGLRYDADTVCTINETTYYKVTDMDFANTNDIRCYEEKYLTQDMISERYSAIVGGSSPIYIDADDGLYMKDSAKGFYIFSDTELNIEKSFEDGYSILAGYDNFGETETADIRIVNVNGTWKICGISFGL